ncbi:hypothetical protein DY245_11485 [Streptomyces inhibens]|uniref:Tetratricopeptide repeat protein n=1 Tax=Streptomyces inhibens TaxID=2293571 RepID=A0A371Q698_STRIH|nr:hypothetical protein [Streptomyces inhibens]REK90220.1 hypothetical protein DY245_11485 [Streptomyces inhibens]
MTTHSHRPSTDTHTDHHTHHNTPMDTDPGIARLLRLAASGDARGTLRALRGADDLPLPDVARIVGRLAHARDFGNLAEAADALVSDAQDPRLLHDFGHACLDRGAAFLALRPLREALRHAPDSSAVRTELVAALEDEHRHAEAVELLEAREATLRPWPDRYLLAYNALMAGDPDRAGSHFARLPVPDEPWRPAHHRLRAMLRRTLALRAAATPHPLEPGPAPEVPAPLAATDLRGWHFALTGGILTTLSPYGYAVGMNGRYGLLQEDPGRVLHGLHRLRLVLARSRVRPRTVSLLPDRSSRILGLAAAGLLDLPAEPFDAARTDTVVIAHRLNGLDRDVLARLRRRTPGQVLFEHATCWTRPPAVSADISTLLGQLVIAPWDAQLHATADGSTNSRPDDRPEQAVADDLLRADPTPDPGDGDTPPDPDTELARFVTVARDAWLTGPRDHVPSPGPVGGSRFG